MLVRGANSACCSEAAQFVRTAESLHIFFTPLVGDVNPHKNLVSYKCFYFESVQRIKDEKN